VHVAVLTAFPDDPASPRGDVETAAVHLAEGLTRLPHLDLDLITLSTTVTSAEVTLWHGARLHRLPFSGRWTLTTALRSGRLAVTELVKKLSPDLLHAHGTCGLMAQHIPTPRVLTVHGFAHAEVLSSRRWAAALRAQAWRFFEKRCWADYRHIIAVSPYVRERLRGFTRAIIHDVENPIGREFFPRTKVERRCVILSTIPIARRKNTLALLEAFALLRGRGIDAQLRLAGEVVDPAYGRQVSTRIVELQLEEHVAVLGALSPGALIEELERASVFALLSLEENAPIRVQEAMAKGLPVVASNLGGLPYQVRHGETGFLVNPADPAEIADRFATLLLDDELRDRAGELAARVALERYHPDAVARRTVEVYMAAAGVRRRPTPRPRILHF
jgi:glycosyltransferase involved in cell wall biosynthesis